MPNKVEKIIRETLPNNMGLNILPEYQFKYSNDVGVISLLPPCGATMNMYEIMCVEGNLFEDIERYDTKEEAEERIFELLEWVQRGRDNKLNEIL